jgi:predicted RNA-binding Zn-ribbon protein involved in translation (DUF1610 family)
MSVQGTSETSFVAGAKAMQEILVAWRAEHPGASFDEIAEEVRKQREVLMGQLLAELAGQHGIGEVLVGHQCPQCGEVLHYKGVKGRTVLHPEGQPHLKRGYHHCDQCGHGFFPSG